MSRPEHPAISIRGLTVEAAGTRILGPVDLDVERGEHVLLVGPLGVGQEHAPAGDRRPGGGPAAGTVSLFGEAMADGAGRLTAPSSAGSACSSRAGPCGPT